MLTEASERVIFGAPAVAGVRPSVRVKALGLP